VSAAGLCAAGLRGRGGQNRQFGFFWKNGRERVNDPGGPDARVVMRLR